jgi:hypothetical protein
MKMSNDVFHKFEHIRKEDKRSITAQIEALIEKEWRSRTPEGIAEAEAAKSFRPKSDYFLDEKHVPRDPNRYWVHGDVVHANPLVIFCRRCDAFVSSMDHFPSTHHGRNLSDREYFLWHKKVMQHRKSRDTSWTRGNLYRPLKAKNVFD